MTGGKLDNKPESPEAQAKPNVFARCGRAVADYFSSRYGGGEGLNASHHHNIRTPAARQYLRAAVLAVSLFGGPSMAFAQAESSSGGVVQADNLTQLQNDVTDAYAALKPKLASSFVPYPQGNQLVQNYLNAVKAYTAAVRAQCPDVAPNITDFASLNSWLGSSFTVGSAAGGAAPSNYSAVTTSPTSLSLNALEAAQTRIQAIAEYVSTHSVSVAVDDNSTTDTRTSFTLDSPASRSSFALFAKSPLGQARLQLIDALEADIPSLASGDQRTMRETIRSLKLSLLNENWDQLYLNARGEYYECENPRIRSSDEGKQKRYDKKYDKDKLAYVEGFRASLPQVASSQVPTTTTRDPINDFVSLLTTVNEIKPGFIRDSDISMIRVEARGGTDVTYKAYVDALSELINTDSTFRAQLIAKMSEGLTEQQRSSLLSDRVTGSMTGQQLIDQYPKVLKAKEATARAGTPVPSTQTPPQVVVNPPTRTTSTTTPTPSPSTRTPGPTSVSLESDDERVMYNPETCNGYIRALQVLSVLFPSDLELVRITRNLSGAVTADNAADMNTYGQQAGTAIRGYVGTKESPIAKWQSGVASVRAELEFIRDNNPAAEKQPRQILKRLDKFIRDNNPAAEKQARQILKRLDKNVSSWDKFLSFYTTQYGQTVPIDFVETESQNTREALVSSRSRELLLIQGITSHPQSSAAGATLIDLIEAQSGSLQQFRTTLARADEVIAAYKANQDIRIQAQPKDVLHMSDYQDLRALLEELALFGVDVTSLIQGLSIESGGATIPANHPKYDAVFNRVINQILVDDTIFNKVVQDLASKLEARKSNATLVQSLLDPNLTPEKLLELYPQVRTGLTHESIEVEDLQKENLLALLDAARMYGVAGAADQWTDLNTSGDYQSALDRTNTYLLGGTILSDIIHGAQEELTAFAQAHPDKNSEASALQPPKTWESEELSVARVYFWYARVRTFVGPPTQTISTAQPTAQPVTTATAPPTVTTVQSSAITEITEAQYHALSAGLDIVTQFGNVSSDLRSELDRLWENRSSRPTALATRYQELQQTVATELQSLWHSGTPLESHLKYCGDSLILLSSDSIIGARAISLRNELTAALRQSNPPANFLETYYSIQQFFTTNNALRTAQACAAPHLVEVLLAFNPSDGLDFGSDNDRFMSEARNAGNALKKTKQGKEGYEAAFNTAYVFSLSHPDEFARAERFVQWKKEKSVTESRYQQALANLTLLADSGYADRSDLTDLQAASNLTSFSCYEAVVMAESYIAINPVTDAMRSTTVQTARAKLLTISQFSPDAEAKAAATTMLQPSTLVGGFTPGTLVDVAQFNREYVAISSLIQKYYAAAEAARVAPTTPPTVATPPTTAQPTVTPVPTTTPSSAETKAPPASTVSPVTVPIPTTAAEHQALYARVHMVAVFGTDTTRSRAKELEAQLTQTYNSGRGLTQPAYSTAATSATTFVQESEASAMVQRSMYILDLVTSFGTGADRTRASNLTTSLLDGATLTPSDLAFIDSKSKELFPKVVAQYTLALSTIGRTQSSNTDQAKQYLAAFGSAQSIEDLRVASLACELFVRDNLGPAQTTIDTNLATLSQDSDPTIAMVATRFIDDPNKMNKPAEYYERASTFIQDPNAYITNNGIARVQAQPPNEVTTAPTEVLPPTMAELPSSQQVSVLAAQLTLISGFSGENTYAANLASALTLADANRGADEDRLRELTQKAVALISIRDRLIVLDAVVQFDDTNGAEAKTIRNQLLDSYNSGDTSKMRDAIEEYDQFTGTTVPKLTQGTIQKAIADANEQIRFINLQLGTSHPILSTSMNVQTFLTTYPQRAVVIRDNLQDARNKYLGERLIEIQRIIDDPSTSAPVLGYASNLRGMIGNYILSPSANFDVLDQSIKDFLTASDRTAYVTNNTPTLLTLQDYTSMAYLLDLLIEHSTGNTRAEALGYRAGLGLYNPTAQSNSKDIVDIKRFIEANLSSLETGYVSSTKAKLATVTTGPYSARAAAASRSLKSGLSQENFIAVSQEAEEVLRVAGVDQLIYIKATVKKLDAVIKAVTDNPLLSSRAREARTALLDLQQHISSSGVASSGSAFVAASQKAEEVLRDARSPSAKPYPSRVTPEEQRYQLRLEKAREMVTDAQASIPSNVPSQFQQSLEQVSRALDSLAVDCDGLLYATTIDPGRADILYTRAKMLASVISNVNALTSVLIDNQSKLTPEISAQLVTGYSMLSTYVADPFITQDKLDQCYDIIYGQVTLLVTPSTSSTLAEARALRAIITSQSLLLQQSLTPADAAEMSAQAISLVERSGLAAEEQPLHDVLAAAKAWKAQKNADATLAMARSLERLCEGYLFLAEFAPSDTAIRSDLDLAREVFLRDFNSNHRTTIAPNASTVIADEAIYRMLPELRLVQGPSENLGGEAHLNSDDRVPVFDTARITPVVEQEQRTLGLLASLHQLSTGRAVELHTANFSNIGVYAEVVFKDLPGIEIIGSNPPYNLYTPDPSRPMDMRYAIGPDGQAHFDDEKLVIVTVPGPAAILSETYRVRETPGLARLPDGTQLDKPNRDMGGPAQAELEREALTYSRDAVTVVPEILRTQTRRDALTRAQFDLVTNRDPSTSLRFSASATISQAESGAYDPDIGALLNGTWGAVIVPGSPPHVLNVTEATSAYNAALFGIAGGIVNPDGSRRLYADGSTVTMATLADRIPPAEKFYFDRARADLELARRFEGEHKYELAIVFAERASEDLTRVHIPPPQTTPTRAPTVSTTVSWHAHIKTPPTPSGRLIVATAGLEANITTTSSAAPPSTIQDIPFTTYRETHPDERLSFTYHWQFYVQPNPGENFYLLRNGERVGMVMENQKIAGYSGSHDIVVAVERNKRGIFVPKTGPDGRPIILFELEPIWSDGQLTAMTRGPYSITRALPSELQDQVNMVTTYLDMYSVRSDGATGSIVYSKPANGQLKAGVVPIKH